MADILVVAEIVEGQVKKSTHHAISFARDASKALGGAFDILAIPSLEEGLPTVAMEALACGVPIVATAVGGTPEVVQHGQTGLLVPATNPASLADALLSLITNENLRLRFAHAGPAVAEQRFQETRMLAQTARVYDEVLQGAVEPSRSAA